MAARLRMMKITMVAGSLVALIVGAGWLALQAGQPNAPAQDRNEIQLATDSPKPLAPKESRKTIRLPGDLRIDLVAGEPLVKQPAAMAFDERGRLFVCEIHGYNLDGYLDALA